MKRNLVVPKTSLLVVSGCGLWGGSTLSEVCQVDTIGDVFGTTGTFDTPEAALGSVVEDPGSFRRVGRDAGHVLFAGPGDPPAEVVELGQDENGWSVYAVNTCRR